MSAYTTTIAALSDGSIVPGGSSWFEQYGPVGAVALLALTGLVILFKSSIADRKAETQRIENERAALAEMVKQQQIAMTASSARMVELVQEQHDQTLELLDRARDESEKRFQALFDRYTAMTDKSSETLKELATVVAKAIDSLSRKLRDGG